MGKTLVIVLIGLVIALVGQALLARFMRTRD
jgi:hypothetical protein